MRWSLDDIRWGEFDPSKVDADLLKVVKAAALVEANSADYVTYLKNVFPDDIEFHTAAEIWGHEEAQHGEALGRWAEMADPGFSFQRSLKWFREGYSLPLDVQQSVRGSHAGELVARSVVESGTSSFYTAIRDQSTEPVLKQIAHRIASDEFAHYQLFQKHLKRYKGEKLSRFQKLRIALGRMKEAEDDELAYAYYAANVQGHENAPAYDRHIYADAYNVRAFGLYQKRHIELATSMVLRAVSFNPKGLAVNIGTKIFWSLIKFKRMLWAWKARPTY